VAKDPNELGALWIKTSARGEYMTGTINGEPVVIFRNDKKTGNQPDWHVLKSRPKGERAKNVNTRTGEISDGPTDMNGFVDDEDIVF
jgi:hypothetical protein